MTIESPKLTKDGYVNECFKFGFIEEEETRNWRKLPETAGIPDLVLKKSFDAGKQIEEAKKKYPDFHFVYIWESKNLLFAQESKKVLEQGLWNSRSKTALLDQLGEWEYWYGSDLSIDPVSFSRALSYWIKSCAVQKSSNNLEYAHPFMMLEYCASNLRLRREAEALYKEMRRIQDIRLDFRGETRINLETKYLKANKKLCRSVKKAIKLLVKHYHIGGKESKKQ